MESYVNIKAIQTVGLTLKGFVETEIGCGLAWSCKIYLKNKKIGSIGNSGDGSPTFTDLPGEIQNSIVKILKLCGYTLALRGPGHVVEEPTDPKDWFVAAVSQMIDELARLRKLRRLAKTHLIVRQRFSADEFEFYKIAPSESSRARLIRQLGDDLICFMNDEILAL